MSAWLQADELGRFWVVDDDGKEYGGPYDTKENAYKAHPEIEGEL